MGQDPASPSQSGEMNSPGIASRGGGRKKHPALGSQRSQILALSGTSRVTLSKVPSLSEPHQLRSG